MQAESLNLPALHTELLRCLTVARHAHDEGVKALKAAANPTERDRHQQVLYGLADTVNAVQGCVYTTGQAIRADGVPASGPLGSAQQGRGD